MKTLHSIKHFVQTYFLVIMACCFVFVEAYSKYVKYHGEVTFAQKGIKALFAFAMIALMAPYLGKFKRQITLVGLLVLTFVAGQLFTTPSFSNNVVITFFRLVFPLVVFLFFRSYTVNTKGRSMFFKFFEFFLILNGILIFSAGFTEVYFFKTYMGERFGYSGLLTNSSTASYFYFLSLFYFPLQYGSGFIKKITFWIALLSALLVGTKVLYLGVVLFAAVCLYFAPIPKKKIWTLVLGVLFLAGIVVFYHFSDAFRTVLNDDGLLSALLSYRDRLLVENTIPYVREHWTWVNYLVGGISDFSLRSQMDLVDVFFFWGLLGGVTYLYTYFVCYFIHRPQGFTLSLFVALAVTVLFAGNFFNYTTVPLYLLLIREVISANVERSINPFSPPKVQ